MAAARVALRRRERASRRSRARTAGAVAAGSMANAGTGASAKLSDAANASACGCLIRAPRPARRNASLPPASHSFASGDVQASRRPPGVRVRSYTRRRDDDACHGQEERTVVAEAAEATSWPRRCSSWSPCSRCWSARTPIPNKVAGPVDVTNLKDYGPAPALDAKGWINSPPLTPADLKGKVVLYDFWTYSCINCQRTFPYVRSWFDRYTRRRARRRRDPLAGVRLREGAQERRGRGEARRRHVARRARRRHDDLERVQEQRAGRPTTSPTATATSATRASAKAATPTPRT